MAENVLGEGKLGRNDRRTDGVILKEAPDFKQVEVVCVVWDAYNSDGHWVAAVLAQTHEGPRTGSPRGARTCWWRRRRSPVAGAELNRPLAVRLVREREPSLVSLPLLIRTLLPWGVGHGLI